LREDFDSHLIARLRKYCDLVNTSYIFTIFLTDWTTNGNPLVVRSRVSAFGSRIRPILSVTLPRLERGASGNYLVYLLTRADLVFAPPFVFSLRWSPTKTSSLFFGSTTEVHPSLEQIIPPVLFDKSPLVAEEPTLPAARGSSSAWTYLGVKPLSALFLPHVFLPNSPAGPAVVSGSTGAGSLTTPAIPAPDALLRG